MWTRLIPKRRRLVLALAATAMAVLSAPGGLRAESGPGSDASTDDDNGPVMSPRAAVKIEGVSVVLIPVDDKLYAFIDRIEDNQPDESAEIVVTPEGGEPLKMSVEGKGLFVAPFERGGLKKASFQVSIQSENGRGQANAEIVYDDDKPGAAPKPGLSRSMLAAVALFAALVGAGIWVLVMKLKWWSPMPAPANLPGEDFRRKIWRFLAQRRTNG
jgi:hypothetical protein